MTRSTYGRRGRPPGHRGHGGRRASWDAHHAGRHDARRERRRRRRAPGRTMVLALAAVFGMFLLVGAVTVAAVYVLVRILPYLLLALVALGAFVWARSRLRHREHDAGPRTPTPRAAAASAAATAERAWLRARVDFQRVRADYAAHETDPMEVLRRPALSDVSVPSTARFVDAFAAAQALDTDDYPGEPYGASYAAAVDAARRAWRAAVDAADRIRLSGLDAEERRTVERVLKLLTTARDSDSEPERLAAYSRARSELDRLDRAGVVHLPRPARAHLDARARGALPGP